MKTNKKTLKNDKSLITEEVDSMITNKLTLGAGVSSAIENLWVLDSSETNANEQMNELQTDVVKWRHRLRFLKPMVYIGSLLILIGVVFCASLSVMTQSNNRGTGDSNAIIYSNISRSLYQELSSAGDVGFQQLGQTINNLPSGTPAIKNDAVTAFTSINQRWKSLSETANNISLVKNTADANNTTLQTAFPYVVWNPNGFKNLTSDLVNIQKTLEVVSYGKPMGSNLSDGRKALMNELYTWAKTSPDDKGWLMAWNSLAQINKPLENIVNGQKDWDDAEQSWAKLRTSLEPVLTSNSDGSISNNNYYIGLTLIVIGFLLLLASALIQMGSAKVNETLVVSTNERVAGVIAGIMSQLNVASHGDLSSIDEIDEKNANTLKGKISFMISDLANLVADIKRSVNKTQDITSEARKNAGILAEHNLDQATRMSEMSRQSMDLLDGLDVVEGEMVGLRKSIESAVSTSHLSSQDSEEAVKGLKDIQGTFDELKVRIKRLLSYNTEFFELGGWMQDVGDQLEVLAIQAQTQALKSSGSGVNEGFKIVAEDIFNLRKQAEEKSQKMASIIQLTETDSDAVKSYLDNTFKTLSQVSSIIGLKNESSKKMEVLISDMNSFMGIVGKSVASQEKTMSELKASTSVSSKMGEEDKEVVNNALSSFNQVTEIVRTLGQKTQKFKVKS